MSKLVNWGRWPVALFFALQGLAISFAAIAGAISMIRDGSGTLYPTYVKLIESTAFLLCSWGLVKMRYWAYWWAAGICTFEIVIIAVVFLSPFTAAHVFGYIIEGIHFQLDSILIPVIIPFVCLVWLFLPSVRAQYLHKEIAA
jgi:hypothetical protein